MICKQFFSYLLIYAFLVQPLPIALSHSDKEGSDTLFIELSRAGPCLLNAADPNYQQLLLVSLFVCEQVARYVSRCLCCYIVSHYVTHPHVNKALQHELLPY